MGLNPTRADLFSFLRKKSCIAVGPLENKNKNKKKNKNWKWRFFISRVAHVNCAIMAMLYTHSVGNQP